MAPACKYTSIKTIILQKTDYGFCVFINLKTVCIMENLKMFMNIGFVILCLAMLWYLFTYDPPKNQRVSSGYEAERGTDYQESDEEYTSYADRSAESYTTDRNYQDRQPAYTPPTPPPAREEYTYEEPIRETQTRYNDSRNSSYDYVDDYSNQANDYIAQEDKGGFFDNIFGSRKKREPVYDARPTPEFEDEYVNTKPKDYNPYYKDRTAEPTPRPRQKTQPAPPPKVATQPSSSGIRYVEKRYSRDGRLGTYKGPMRNGKPHGFATFRYDSGDMYVGEYRNGARNGYGNSIYRQSKKIQLRKYVDGNKIEARNISGVTYGSMRFVNGKNQNGTFYGPLKNGEPHGYGYFKYENGDVYIGTYRNGKRDGYGNSIYANGRIEFRKYRNGKQVKD